MAKRTFRTSKALTFMYEIATDEFVHSNPNSSQDVRHYTIDLVVDKHPEYPDIHPSIWTVTLSIANRDGDIIEAVEPKAGPGSLKNPNLVLVDWTIRRTLHANDVEEDPCGDCFWHIGPDGFTPGRNEYSRQLVGCCFDGGQCHRVLAKDACLLVCLTFTVEKTTPCGGLETLYKSGLLSDCKLVCDERDFSVHRAILAAHSPVFAAMFANDMMEKSSGICSISDVRPDVLDALLQYLYTGQLDKANGKLELLWIAADKYDIQDLKSDCERLILGSMNEDNALDYLMFAAQRGLDKIVVEAAKVIAQQNVWSG